MQLKLIFDNLVSLSFFLSVYKQSKDLFPKTSCTCLWNFCWLTYVHKRSTNIAQV